MLGTEWSERIRTVSRPLACPKAERSLMLASATTVLVMSNAWSVLVQFSTSLSTVGPVSGTAMVGGLKAILLATSPNIVRNRLIFFTGEKDLVLVGLFEPNLSRTSIAYIKNLSSPHFYDILLLPKTFNYK
ncbi:MAG: hypothetical protein QG551_134 [Patescibacteria group bacterium]|nr:hypothetical protein [Patescibacteria group bacterium]